MEICRGDLSMFPNKLSLSEALQEDGTEGLLIVAVKCGALMKGTSTILNGAWLPMKRISARLTTLTSKISDFEL
jgi:hypothetical protein